MILHCTYNHPPPPFFHSPLHMWIKVHWVCDEFCHINLSFKRERFSLPATFLFLRIVSPTDPPDSTTHTSSTIRFSAYLLPSSSVLTHTHTLQFISGQQATNHLSCKHRSSLLWLRYCILVHYLCCSSLWVVPISNRSPKSRAELDSMNDLNPN